MSLWGRGDRGEAPRSCSRIPEPASTSSRSLLRTGRLSPCSAQVARDGGNGVFERRSPTQGGDGTTRGSRSSPVSHNASSHGAFLMRKRMSARYMGRSCLLRSEQGAALPQDQSLHLTVGAREPQSPDTLTSPANQPLPLLVWAQNKGKATGDMLPARPGTPPHHNKHPANHTGTQQNESAHIPTTRLFVCAGFF